MNKGVIKNFLNKQVQEIVNSMNRKKNSRTVSGNSM